MTSPVSGNVVKAKGDWNGRQQSAALMTWFLARLYFLLGSWTIFGPLWGSFNGCHLFLSTVEYATQMLGCSRLTFPLKGIRTHLYQWLSSNIPSYAVWPLRSFISGCTGRKRAINSSGQTSGPDTRSSSDWENDVLRVYIPMCQPNTAHCRCAELPGSLLHATRQGRWSS